MPEYKGVSYGVEGTRGGGLGCGMFHEFSPGPDGMCDSCRLAPDNAFVIAANKWFVKKRIRVKYGSKEWGEALHKFDDAGAPGYKAKKTKVGRKSK